MHLEASAPSFIDALITPHAGRNDRLDRIDRLIDWPKVAALLNDVHAAYGYWRVRCMGLRRNEAEALFKALAYNLRRADGLREGCAALG